MKCTAMVMVHMNTEVFSNYRSEFRSNMRKKGKKRNQNKKKVKEKMLMMTF